MLVLGLETGVGLCSSVSSFVPDVPSGFSDEEEKLEYRTFVLLLMPVSAQVLFVESKNKPSSEHD